jgi:uncharacterized protein (TIGR03437 family)
MFRNVLLCVFLLSPAISIAPAQDFLLSPGFAEAFPIGPIASVANLSAARDSQSNLYILSNGLTNNCVGVGSPPFGCVLQPASYLVKLNAAADTVLFQQTLPFLASAMTADPDGNIYLAGGNIVEKLASDGTQVLYKNTVGGPTLNFTALALDSSGRLYLTGGVGAGDLPATAGSLRPTAPAGNGPLGFVMRLTTAGVTDYATYLGDAVQNPYGIAADASGAAFVIWSTNSTSFPATPPASANGASYLVRLSPDGSKLIYSTSPAQGDAWLLTADSGGHAAIALEAAYGSGITVIRYNPDGTVAFTRNVPGVTAGGLGTDASGNIYLYDSVLPVSANYPVKNTLSGCAYGSNALTVYDPNGNLVQSTYLPGLGVPLGINVLTGPSVDLFAGETVTHLAQTPGATTVPLACVGNAASYNNGIISPGELVSLFGDGLGPAAGTEPQVTLASGFPTQLAGVKVTFNGIAAPLLYAQDNQINAIVPWELSPYSQVQVCAAYNGGPPACTGASSAPTDPGVFMLDQNHAVALNQNGTLNTASNPAKVGDVVSIFATGLGATNPLPADGSIVGLPLPADILPVTMAAFSETGTLIPITVNYFGPVPYQVAGFSQINFTVDANAGGPYATYLSVGAPATAVQSNPFYINVAQ